MESSLGTVPKASHNVDGIVSYVVLGFAVVLSAIGYYIVGKWVSPGSDSTNKFLLAIFRTLITLVPALGAFWLANRRQRALHKSMGEDIDKLKELMNSHSQLQAIEHELQTMDRLSKVVRNAVIATAASSQELFTAIQAMPDSPSKDLLIERYRHHTSGVATVLSSVNEQLSESGIAIAENLNAHESINIVDRATKNNDQGFEIAQKMIESRGIGDGLKQLKTSIEQAQALQLAIKKTVESLNAPNPLNMIKGE